MPGLSSFCITAAVCIGFIFVLQVSWTVAWLAVDQRRIENNLHGIFPWIQLSDNNNSTAASVTSQNIWREKFVRFYADLFKYWPFKVGNIKNLQELNHLYFGSDSGAGCHWNFVVGWCLWFYSHRPEI